MKKKLLLLLIGILAFIPLNIKAQTLIDYVTSLANTDTVNVATDDPDHNIRFIGANPNNYVEFNGELWRIVGIFDGKVKIMRNDPIGSYAWDSTDSSINNGYGINEWSTSKLKEELNGDYLNYNLTEDTLWYNGSNNKREATFDHTKVLSADAQSYITDGVWNTGPDNSYDGTYYSNVKNAPAEFRYNSEKYSNDSKKCTSARCNDTVERHSNWTGKVGLITYADYVYSTAGGNTRNREYCLTNSWGWDTDCNKNSWMYNYRQAYWSLSPNAQNSNNSYVISFTSYPNDGYAINVEQVRPAVYLKTNTLLVGGTGTSDDPYTLDLAKIITFDTRGGSTINEGMVEYGQKIAQPTDPTKEYSTFLGWYTDETLTNQYDFDSEITSDITLYAKWKFNYKILEGADQTFDKDEIVIKTNGDLTKLKDIKVNDKVLDKENYTLESGSTILKLKTDYLNILTSNTYTINFVYEDGEVSTTLKIAAKEENKVEEVETKEEVKETKLNNPKTSDNIVLYISILGISIIGIIGSGLYLKKKEN